MVLSRRSCFRKNGKPGTGCAKSGALVGNRFLKEFNQKSMAQMCIDINIKASLIWMGGVSSPMLFFIGALLTTMNFYGYYMRKCATLCCPSHAVCEAALALSSKTLVAIAELRFLYLPCDKNLDQATVSELFAYLWISTLCISSLVAVFFMATPVSCGPHYEMLTDGSRPWYEGTEIMATVGEWMTRMKETPAEETGWLTNVVEWVSTACRPAAYAPSQLTSQCHWTGVSAPFVVNSSVWAQVLSIFALLSNPLVLSGIIVVLLMWLYMLRAKKDGLESQLKLGEKRLRVRRNTDSSTPPPVRVERWHRYTCAAPPLLLAAAKTLLADVASWPGRA